MVLRLMTGFPSIAVSALAGIIQNIIERTNPFCVLCFRQGFLVNSLSFTANTFWSEDNANFGTAICIRLPMAYSEVKKKTNLLSLLWLNVEDGRGWSSVIIFVITGMLFPIFTKTPILLQYPPSYYYLSHKSKVHFWYC